MFKWMMFLGIFSLAQAATLTLGTTSTTVNSGLMDYWLSDFTKKTHHSVKVITGGTGFILKQLENQDVEMGITHQVLLEDHLLKKYPKALRTPLMYNHFVLIGPVRNPAKIQNSDSFETALQKIFKTKSLLISRGDQSGTHLFELSIWQKLKLHPQNQKEGYHEAGQDMGPTIQIANQLQAYTIADEGTWRAYEKKTTLKTYHIGAQDGLNHYHVIVLKPIETLSPQAQAFMHWINDSKSRASINHFRILGQQVFFAEPIGR